MFFEYGDVDYLKEAPTVTNDPAHADRGYAMKKLYGKECLWQPTFRGLYRFGAQAGFGAQ